MHHCRWQGRHRSGSAPLDPDNPTAPFRDRHGTTPAKPAALPATDGRCAPGRLERKTLAEMNVRLDSAISDISRVTGRRNLRAIVDGGCDLRRLAAPWDERIKATCLKVGAALRLIWRCTLRLPCRTDRSLQFLAGMPCRSETLRCGRIVKRSCTTACTIWVKSLGLRLLHLPRFGDDGTLSSM